MTRLTRMLFAADGGAGGGAVQEPANAGQPKEPAKPEPAQPAELEALKAEIEALKKEKADKEKTEQEAKLAAMSEEERKKAEQDALRKQLVEENRKIQLQKVGLDDEFAELVTGDTAEEISKRGVSDFLVHYNPFPMAKAGDLCVMKSRTNLFSQLPIISQTRCIAYFSVLHVKIQTSD